jgi:hypothetical protein
VTEVQGLTAELLARLQQLPPHELRLAENGLRGKVDLKPLPRIAAAPERSHTLRAIAGGACASSAEQTARPALLLVPKA